MTRHYGMDWLRIGAFALLILYHIGMVFVPWDWHVKTARPSDWVQFPMLFTNAWRLILLFVVSGFASRALWGKRRQLGGFLRERSVRLLVPLLFAGCVIIPPQPWIELIGKHGYAHGFGWFLTHDYFRFGTLHGIVLPTWQHLWFVVYLWTYSVVLIALIAVVRAAPVQRWFDRLFGGWGLMALPIAWLWTLHLLLLPGVEETHDLIGDPAAHLVYLPAFLFGFGLGRSAPTFAAIARWWKAAGVLALIGYAAVAAILALWLTGSVPPDRLESAFVVARAVQGWASIVALIGLADRFANRDHRWRATLSEAVFPFYIIHQTIIVVIAWTIVPLALGQAAEFAALLAATIAGCWLFYAIGRRVAPLRPLIGLRPGMAREARSATTATPP